MIDCIGLRPKTIRACPDVHVRVLKLENKAIRDEVSLPATESLITLLQKIHTYVHLFVQIRIFPRLVILTHELI